ncbi:MAG: hypothetical protein ACM3ML_24505 [Micromonosporaceae bacterium]
MSEVLTVPTKVARAAWHVLPRWVRRRLRSDAGKRLVRFAPAAGTALAATQTVYFVCLGLAGLTAGIAGVAGWFSGAATSYVVSRWSWERKGRPDLLKETLPFWAISVCVGFTLTAASKFASHQAHTLGLHGAERIAFVQGLYFLANCVTFLIRFAIFHYVVFTDGGARGGPAQPRRPDRPGGDAEALPARDMTYMAARRFED